MDQPTEHQIIPGAVRTASPLIAAAIVAEGVKLGFEVSDVTAYRIALPAALVYYVVTRWREIKGSAFATRLLGLGSKAKPTFKAPPK